MQCDVCSEFPEDDPRFGYHDATHVIQFTDGEGNQQDRFLSCPAGIKLTVAGLVDTIGLDEIHIARI